MAFTFQFQSILDLKIRLEDLKKSKLGEVTEILNSEMEKLNILLVERKNQFKLMKEKSDKGFTPKELIFYNNYMERLKKSISIQEIVVKRAKDAVEKARLELVDAAKQRKMFETLKEKKMEEYWEEYYRKEQITLDEIASYRHRVGGEVANGEEE